MIKRRLGNDPHIGGRKTAACDGCPDMFELEDGDFAVIGTTATELLRPHLPPTAGCGPDETIIVIPRHTLVEARPDIPGSV
ncbi:hypothetical protein BH23VER1_BH23VER1_07220 [soil metagenome]